MVFSDICICSDIFVSEFRATINHTFRMGISSDWWQTRKRVLGASKWYPEVHRSISTFQFLPWLVETCSSLHNGSYSCPLNNVGEEGLVGPPPHSRKSAYNFWLSAGHLYLWMENCFPSTVRNPGLKASGGNVKILFCIWSWLNPHMGNPQIPRADCIYWKNKIKQKTLISAPTQFKLVFQRSTSRELFFGEEVDPRDCKVLWGV